MTNDNQSTIDQVEQAEQTESASTIEVNLKPLTKSAGKLVDAALEASAAFSAISSEMLQKYPFLARSGAVDIPAPQQEIGEFFDSSPLSIYLQDAWKLRERVALSVKHASGEDLPGYVTAALHRSRTGVEQYYDSLMELIKVQTGFSPFALEEYLRQDAGDNGI